MSAVLDLRSEDLIIQFRKGITLDVFLGYFSTADKGATYQVIDLTGYTGTLKAYLPNSSVVLTGFDLTTENGGLIIEQRSYPDKNGVVHAGAWGVTIYVTNAITETIDWKKANYTSKLITPTGKVIDFVAGRFEVDL